MSVFIHFIFLLTAIIAYNSTKNTIGRPFAVYLVEFKQCKQTQLYEL